MTTPEETKLTALVTGGSSGIGLATARALAGAGYPTVICGRNEDSLRQAAKQLADEGLAVTTVTADVTDTSSVRHLVQAATEAHGPIGVLVNNAGRNGGGVTAQLTDELWHQVINTNLNSVFYVTREVLARGGMTEGGRIINVASTAGKQGVLLAAPYSASKHGVVGFTKALGKELAPQRITVNAVCPGYVETPMAERVRHAYAEAWGTTEDDVLTAFEAKIPLGRYSTPEEVASMILYLAMPVAASVTAQALNVCGGLGNF
ncbi:MAG TPA: SDR family NAD(P)-dependent oxidoreductase [Jatrophihabitans sp.]|jgi:ketoreductase|uniref:SDR family NAD(P)-dependent oxidoreductase n=1 Tax=Jatrophihabitans sp. TaxID=1932789 RepID=UPI002EE21B80